VTVDWARRREYTLGMRRLLYSFCLCLLAAPVALAQAPSAPALPAVLERPEATRPEQRAELQKELERHAKLIEAQSAVVKIVAKLVGPSVVHIESDVPSENNSGQSRNRHVEEAGAGVIIQQQGAYYVLTNSHVIRGAADKAIRINLADGRRIHPTKVLQDKETDVAVLAVSAPDLVAAPLGDSDRLQIGDFVLAMGSPFGLSQSVTFGIISAKGRRALHLGDVDRDAHVDREVLYQDFLQTDAAINPGNSGGPLVNLRGEVVGINTAIASKSGGNEGIAFAIPTNMFRVVARQLIETGTVARAFLGVHLNSQFGPAMAAELGLPRPVGAHINGIIPRSPAENAKLQTDDVILEFNRTPIEDDAHLVNLVSLTEVGKKVPLLIFRNRKPISVMVEVGDRSKFGK
jgi:serine protease Do